MNRRDFLKRLGGLAAAVTLSPMLDLAPIEAAPSAYGGLTYMGIPLVFDACCPADQFYFISPKAIWLIKADHAYRITNLTPMYPKRLGIVTSISE